MASKVNQSIYYSTDGGKPPEVIDEEKRLKESFGHAALSIVWSKQSDDGKTWEVYWYVPTYNKTRFRYDEDGVLIPSLKIRFAAFLKSLFTRLGYHVE